MKELKEKAIESLNRRKAHTEQLIKRLEERAKMKDAARLGKIILSHKAHLEKLNQEDPNLIAEKRLKIRGEIGERRLKDKKIRK
jgi:hypothetical protein